MICQKIKKVEFGHPVYVAATERRITEKAYEASDVSGRQACESLVLDFSALGLERTKVLSASLSIEDSLRYHIAMRRKDSCQCWLTKGEPQTFPVHTLGETASA